MREVTKSMMSCTLAMSMFSVRQLISLITGRSGKENGGAADAFNQIAATAAGQMDEAMRATFQAGDRWQRQMVDLIFVPGSLVSANPGKWIGKISAPSGPAEGQASPSPAAGASPAPPPPTWSWGSPRNSSPTVDPPVSRPPDNASSSPVQSPAPGPAGGTPSDSGQDTGWGPMP
jgi:hypothetical protein